VLGQHFYLISLAQKSCGDVWPMDLMNGCPGLRHTWLVARTAF